MSRRLQIAGGAAVLGGLLVALLGDTIPVDVPYLLVVLLALGALLAMLARVVDSTTAVPGWGRLPDTEGGDEVPTPGDSLDPATGTGRRGAFRRRLRRLTVRSVMAARGCSRATARAAVADGEWTDDPVAAAFLGDGLAIPLRIRLGWWLRDAGDFEDRAARTVRALERFRDESVHGEGVPLTWDAGQPFDDSPLELRPTGHREAPGAARGGEP